MRGTSVRNQESKIQTFLNYLLSSWGNAYKREILKLFFNY